MADLAAGLVIDDRETAVVQPIHAVDAHGQLQALQFDHLILLQCHHLKGPGACAFNAQPFDHQARQARCLDSAKTLCEQIGSTPPDILERGHSERRDQCRQAVVIQRGEGARGLQRLPHPLQEFMDQSAKHGPIGGMARLIERGGAQAILRHRPERAVGLRTQQRGTTAHLGRRPTGPGGWHRLATVGSGAGGVQCRRVQRGEGRTRHGRPVVYQRTDALCTVPIATGMTGNDCLCVVQQTLEQGPGKFEFTRRRGVRHAEFALQLRGQQRVWARCGRPVLVVHAEQPDGVERHAGGFQRA